MTESKRGFFRLACLGLGVLLVLLAGAGRLQAAPSLGEISSEEQPDGSRVDVRLYGDEFYLRGEGLDGFTVIRDPKTGYICYAALNADGSEYVSTGEIYRGSQTGEAAGSGASASSASAAVAALRGRGIGPGLDLKPEARGRIRARARRELGLDAEEEKEDAAPAIAPPLGKVSAEAAETADSVKRVTGVIVLVDFPDVPANFTREQISDLGNLKGYVANGNNGSIRDYFLDVSHGKFEYTLTVTDYYRAKNNKAYYDRAEGYAGGQELIKEALLALDARGYDFSKLTTSASGTVRGVNVLFAGAPGKVWAQGIWAHRGNISTLNFDGVKVSGYMLSNIGSTGMTIGTFIHESGHLLFGWPDLYDYDSDSRGAGSFCLMSGQFSKNPQPPNAYFRIGQGWETVSDLKAAANGLITVPSNGRANYKYVNPANAKESFVIENIAKKGRWANIPDDGLMVWHVDDGGNNSFQDRTLARHYRVAVMQADGKFDLERNVNGGGANDLFHFGNNPAFTGLSAPDSKWWSGSASGLDIINISAVKDTMTFQLAGMPVGIGRFAAAPGPSGPDATAHAWRMDGRRVDVRLDAQGRPLGLHGGLASAPRR
jgi:M6 family metalloprotease-like protein